MTQTAILRTEGLPDIEIPEPEYLPEYYLVAVAEEPRSVDVRFASLPAEVLVDRYNSKYDHLFPKVRRKNKRYKLAGRDAQGRWVYVFEGFDEYVVRDRD